MAIFNQPPLNLIDPSDKLFEMVNSEKLESYDELCWSDLLERYLDNQVFIANSPLSDIINDRAHYTRCCLQLCKMFFDEDIVLPIVESMPCWDLNDSKKTNEQVLKLAREKKDDYVLAHRYLEGGMGFRVGHVTSKDEWESFIDTFVVDRPYLYVLRSRFEMDPDMSVRVLSAMSMPQLTSSVESDANYELTDTLYARLTTQPPLGTDNHRSFLIYKASPSAPGTQLQVQRNQHQVEKPVEGD